jgi:hypothetical protein
MYNFIVNARCNVQDLTRLFYILKPYVLGARVTHTHSVERNLLTSVLNRQIL